MGIATLKNVAASLQAFPKNNTKLMGLKSVAPTTQRMTGFYVPCDEVSGTNIAWNYNNTTALVAGTPMVGFAAATSEGVLINSATGFDVSAMGTPYYALSAINMGSWTCVRFKFDEVAFTTTLGTATSDSLVSMLPTSSGFFRMIYTDSFAETTAVSPSGGGHLNVVVPADKWLNVAILTYRSAGQSFVCVVVNGIEYLFTLTQAVDVNVPLIGLFSLATNSTRCKGFAGGSAPLGTLTIADYKAAMQQTLTGWTNGNHSIHPALWY